MPIERHEANNMSDGTWEPIPQGWAAIQHAGPMPDAVFRYRSLDDRDVERKIIFEVVDECIYLAGLGKMNDKREGRFRWLVEGNEAEIYEFCLRITRNVRPYEALVEQERHARVMTQDLIARGNRVPPHIVDQFTDVLGQLVRVACFTTDPLNDVMWAHYAKFIGNEQSLDNAGICIEYLCDDSWRNSGLNPVRYSDDPVTVNYLGTPTEQAERLARASLIKGKRWKYEEEWRLIGYLQTSVPPPYDANLTTNSKVMFTGSVRSVTFGMDCPLSLIERVRSVLKANDKLIPLRLVVWDRSAQRPTLQTI